MNESFEAAWVWTSFMHNSPASLIEKSACSPMTSGFKKKIFRAINRDQISRGRFPNTGNCDHPVSRVLVISSKGWSPGSGSTAF